MPMNNKELELVWHLVESTGANVFLTGKAGTGKTTFLRKFREATRKRAVVLAPTGIAAINAGGSTLHSFFQLPFGPFIPGAAGRDEGKRFRFGKRKIQLIRSLDLLIIDEISMVRADVLDAVDDVLRRYRDRARPFGGVQLLMIGDLQQLAPVAKAEEWEMLSKYYETQYFFSSLALREVGFVSVELHTVYRQTDAEFVSILNAVRSNTADAGILARINERYMPDFEPADEEGYVRLTTHNYQADRVNEEKMEQLQTPARTFVATIKGEFPELSYPTAQHLRLKVGAQVMFVKNDSSGERQYFNGMLGRVVDMTETTVTVRAHDTGRDITVAQEEWKNVRYGLSDATKEIVEEELGCFAQIPLKAAWAITVHKSQGLTFARAIIDVQHSFTHGQTYVALSRCKSLEGMVLSAPIPPAAIITDPCIAAFNDGISAQTPTPSRVRDMEREYFLSLLSDLFDFVPLRQALDAYTRVIDEFLFRQYPQQLAAIKAARDAFAERVVKVANNFAVQYSAMVMKGYDYAEDALLQERCQKGANYFFGELEEMRKTLKENGVASGNKTIEERLGRHTEEFSTLLRIKLFLLRYFSLQTFSVASYLRQRAVTTIGPMEKKADRTKAKTKRGASKNLKPESRRGRMEDEDASLQEETAAARWAEQEMAEEANSYAAGELTEYPDMPDLQYDGLPY